MAPPESRETNSVGKRAGSERGRRSLDWTWSRDRADPNWKKRTVIVEVYSTEIILLLVAEAHLLETRDYQCQTLLMLVILSCLHSSCTFYVSGILLVLHESVCYCISINQSSRNIHALCQSPSVINQFANSSSRFFSASSVASSPTSLAGPLRLNRCWPVKRVAWICRPEKKRPCIF